MYIYHDLLTYFVALIWVLINSVWLAVPRKYFTILLFLLQTFLLSTIAIVFFTPATNPRPLLNVSSGLIPNSAVSELKFEIREASNQQIITISLINSPNGSLATWSYLLYGTVSTTGCSEKVGAVVCEIFFGVAIRAAGPNFFLYYSQVSAKLR